jgi:glycosyltransferase involved in cell wall biosynthesis
MTADALGGVWTYSLDLAEGLGRAGVATSLAVMGPSPSRDQLDQARAIPGLAVIDTGLPLDWLAAEPAEVRAAGAAVSALARALGADLVHLNSPALAAGGGFPAPVAGVCHSCTATWWSAVKQGPMPEDFRWRAQMVHDGMLACDVLIAPTSGFAALTAAVYQTPRPLVVYNGRKPAAAQGIRREPIVFTCGRLWDEGKNVAVLDAAAALLGAPLMAAGPLQGPAGELVRLRHARALGSSPAQEVARWLARSPIFASAARYEPFGLGVLEAAQAGCALVLSDIPTFRELWDGAALFAPADSPEAFAAMFRRLLDHPAEAEWLGHLARMRAGLFSVEAMAAGVLEVYRLIRPERFSPVRVEAAE